MKISVLRFFTFTLAFMFFMLQSSFAHPIYFKDIEVNCNSYIENGYCSISFKICVPSTAEEQRYTYTDLAVWYHQRALSEHLNGIIHKGTCVEKTLAFYQPRCNELSEEDMEASRIEYALVLFYLKSDGIKDYIPPYVFSVEKDIKCRKSCYDAGCVCVDRPADCNEQTHYTTSEYSCSLGICCCPKSSEESEEGENEEGGSQEGSCAYYIYTDNSECTSEDCEYLEDIKTVDVSSSRYIETITLKDDSSSACRDKEFKLRFWWKNCGSGSIEGAGDSCSSGASSGSCEIEAEIPTGGEEDITIKLTEGVSTTCEAYLDVYSPDDELLLRITRTIHFPEERSTCDNDCNCEEGETEMCGDCRLPDLRVSAQLTPATQSSYYRVKYTISKTGGCKDMNGKKIKVELHTSSGSVVNTKEYSYPFTFPISDEFSASFACEQTNILPLKIKVSAVGFEESNENNNEATITQSDVSNFCSGGGGEENEEEESGEEEENEESCQNQCTQDSYVCDAEQKRVIWKECGNFDEDSCKEYKSHVYEITQERCEKIREYDKNSNDKIDKDEALSAIMDYMKNQNEEKRKLTTILVSLYQCKAKISDFCENEEETCENECSQENVKKCGSDIGKSANKIYQCKDQNGDGCLEWVEVQTCSENQICKNAQCVQKPKENKVKITKYNFPSQAEVGISVNDYVLQGKIVEVKEGISTITAALCIKLSDGKENGVEIKGDSGFVGLKNSNLWCYRFTAGKGVIFEVPAADYPLRCREEGEYKFSLLAGYTENNKLKKTDEISNAFTLKCEQTQECNKPDLEVSIEEVNLVENKISYKIVIKNADKLEQNSFKVSIFAGENEVASQEVNVEDDCQDGENNEKICRKEVEVNLKSHCPSSGTSEIKIKVDSENSVEECDENDASNIAKTYYSCRGSGGEIEVEMVKTSLALSAQDVESQEQYYMLVLQKGWNMISLPSEKSIQLSDISCRIYPKVFYFDPQRYQWEKKEIIQPNQGAFIYAYEQCVIPLRVAVQKIGTLSLVERKWNLVAGDGITKVSDIKEKCGRAYVFYWDPRNRRWVRLHENNDAVLEEGKAYWVYVFRNCKV